MVLGPALEAQERANRFSWGLVAGTSVTTAPSTRCVDGLTSITYFRVIGKGTCARSELGTKVRPAFGVSAAIRAAGSLTISTDLLLNVKGHSGGRFCVTPSNGVTDCSMQVGSESLTYLELVPSVRYTHAESRVRPFVAVGGGAALLAFCSIKSRNWAGWDQCEEARSFDLLATGSLGVTLGTNERWSLQVRYARGFLNTWVGTPFGGEHRSVSFLLGTRVGRS